MKKILTWLCVLVGMAGVCLLFSETEVTAPMSSQIWLTLKGAGLIALAVLVGSFINRNEREDA